MNRSGVAQEAARLCQLADRIAAVQRGDGTFAPPAHQRVRAVLDEAMALVDAIATHLAAAPVAAAVRADVEGWWDRGLDAPPTFDRTVAAFGDRCAGGSGDHLFFGVCRTPNGIRGSGRFFEAFVAYDEVPLELARLRFECRHPGALCRPVRAVSASMGFGEGHCLVFFPENVATSRPIEVQAFSLFFFDKWPQLYRTQTLPRSASALAEWADVDWASAVASDVTLHAARCTWGHLHDHFHHTGPRPLHQHLQAKCAWHAGVAEELKVDCQVMLAARAGQVPHDRELWEMVLLERLVRYPTDAEPTQAFDAATGVVLFEWLRREGAVEVPDGLLRVVDDRLDAALGSFVVAVEAVERAAPDDQSLRDGTKAFVTGLLPPPLGTDRFSHPAAYPRALRPREREVA